jgi:tRNA(adenine34) deaminase
VVDYEYFMQKALEEAQAALTAGEFPVGCIMVYDKKILVSGARKGTTGDYPNEVDHAELVALRRLFSLDSKVNMREVTAFSTLEPCLMCFGALMISGIGKLVFAYEDPMGGGTQCDATQLPPLYQTNQMAIIPGVLRNKSLKLLKAFFSGPKNTYLKDSLLAAYTLDQ